MQATRIKFPTAHGRGLGPLHFPPHAPSLNVGNFAYNPAIPGWIVSSEWQLQTQRRCDHERAGGGGGQGGGGGGRSGGNAGNRGGQTAANLSPKAQACIAQAQAQVQQELQTFAGYAGARLFGRIAIGAGFGALSIARWTKYGGSWGMAAGAAIGGTIGAVSVAWQDSRTIQNIQNSFMDKFQACMQKSSIPSVPTF